MAGYMYAGLYMKPTLLFEKKKNFQFDLPDQFEVPVLVVAPHRCQ